MNNQDHALLRNVIQSVHALEEDLMTFEQKYGLLSETFYAVYMQGEEPRNEEWVLDWSSWAGAYQSLVKLKQRYYQLIQPIQFETTTLAKMIEVLA